ncbi:MAG: GntR family transcriptional regulator [Spirochaetaceae bacterium]|nr:MAG: GntR family transcriptional regulator [Spirochaetaceae bacterium]
MEFNDSRSIYLQIVDYITTGILCNRYREGERIPSVREMAMDIEVNPNTVTRSYAELQERNIIQNQRGIGYFVSEGAYRRIRDDRVRELLENEVPRLVQTLHLLNLGLDEVIEVMKTRYQETPQ